MRKIILLFAYIVSYVSMYAQNPLNVAGWQPNGSVLSITEDANHIYLGGSFNKMFKENVSGMKQTSGAVFPDGVSDDVIQGFPKVNGRIEVCIPSGGGGWFIGGNFTEVGGLTRNRIARILEDKTVDPDWNPNANFEVRSLFLDGPHLYVGGAFTNIGGQARNRIARLSITGSGAADSWNPNSGGIVYALIVSGSNVYVGGDFTSIGGQARNGIARLSTGNNTADSWNPNAIGGEVFALRLSGNDLYVGGAFTNIGGQARNRIARLSTSSNAADSWNPNANGTVRTLLLAGTNLFVGGAFTNIGGQARNRIARLSTSSDTADSWNADITGTIVRALALSGDNLHVGGVFTLVSGQARSSLARVSRTTGALTSWNPNPNGSVNALAFSGGNLYVGGDFGQIGGTTRGHVARIQKSNQELDLSWNPNSDGEVRALAILGGNLYFGGTFSVVDGQVRNRLASVSTSTGTIEAWNPNVDGFVNALLASESNLYVGGSFSNIGATSRNSLARLSASTGLADSWAPNPNDEVFTLALSGSNLYVGGRFSNIGGQPWLALARVSTSTGLADATWNTSPSFGATVRTLLVVDNSLYVGGDFGIIGGAFRNSLARLSTSTALADSWNPDNNGSVNTLALSGSSLYVGGNFTSIGGQTRNRLARLSTTSDVADSWNPNMGGVGTPNVSALVFSGNILYAGGNFSLVQGQNTVGLAILPTTGSISAAANLTSLNTIYGTPSDPGSFVVSGSLLAAGITVSAPTGFEVSLSQTTGFANTLLVGSSGSVNPTSIFVRLRANTPAGSYSGNIILSSSGANNVEVSIPSSIVAPKELSISGLSANNKVFDGNTNASLSGTASLVGIISGDNVALSGTPIANFNTPEVGTNKQVTVTGYSLSGSDAANYTLAPLVLIADISAAPAEPSEPNEPPTSIGVDSSFDFSAYPNPTQDRVQISLPSSEKIELRVLDYQGRVMRKQYYEHQSIIELSFKDFERGMYLIEILGKGTKAVKRISKL